MSLTTMAMIGISFLSGIACFLFGTIWGRELAHKEMRNLHDYVAKDVDQF